MSSLERWLGCACVCVCLHAVPVSVKKNSKGPSIFPGRSEVGDFDPFIAFGGGGGGGGGGRGGEGEGRGGGGVGEGRGGETIHCPHCD